MNKEDDRTVNKEAEKSAFARPTPGLPADDLPAETPTGQPHAEQSTHNEAALELTRIEAGPQITDRGPSGGGRTSANIK